MTLKSTYGPDVASWNNDEEIDAMSTALDFRTKLQIAILVVLLVIALLGERAGAQIGPPFVPTPTVSPLPTVRPMPIPACVVLHCLAYLPLVHR